MAISFVNLVGAREEPDKIIRALLENQWTRANVKNVLVKFQSDSEEPDFISGDDNTNMNLVGVRWLITERVKNKENEPNGDTIHHYIHRLAINVWGETMNVALLMCDEVNRILWENRPGNSVRLDKSDGDDSEADYFEETEIDFERIEPDNPIDPKPSFEGILEIHFRKRKT